ncbi:MAG: hypothetical protein JO336_03925 [Acidobacteriia bacterium]|nr:hypothetical protein [Terriglobia bacterium]MBV8903997.1 hypothetical protein [Terriglobia bacterium]MBV9746655.1 hypothetical protein [Terriglobia bacterium]
MDGLSLSGISGPDLDSALTVSKSHPTKAEDAAKQFEALMLAQVMRSERESGNGWLGTGEDSSGSSAIDFAEQQLALLLARQGGIGLANMISSNLEPRS